MSKSQEKNTEISARILSLREYFEKTQREFATMIKASPSSIANWEGGSSEPSASTLRGIIDACNVASEWLLLGEGPMFRNSDQFADANKMVSAAPIVADIDLVPLYECVQAGPDGRFIEDSFDAYLPRPVGVIEKQLLAFEVRGDSMLPIYKDGDVVYAAPLEAPRDGDHVVVSVLGNGDQPEAMLKVWDSAGPGKVRLRSLNSEVGPIEITRESVKQKFRVVAHLWARNARNARIAAPAKVASEK